MKKEETKTTLTVHAEKPGAVVQSKKLTYLLKKQAAAPIPPGMPIAVGKICYTKGEPNRNIHPAWIIPVPGSKSAQQLESITGLIVWHKSMRTFWEPNKPLKTPPRCSSKNTFTPDVENPIHTTCEGCPLRNYQVVEASIEKGANDKMGVPCKFTLHVMFLPAQKIGAGEFNYNDLKEIVNGGYNPIRRMHEIALTTTSCVKAYPGSIATFFNDQDTAGKIFSFIPVTLTLQSAVSGQGYDYAKVIVTQIGEIEIDETDPVIIEYAEYIEAAMNYLDGCDATSMEEYMQEPEAQPEAEPAPEV